MRIIIASVDVSSIIAIILGPVHEVLIASGLANILKIEIVT